MTRSRRFLRIAKTLFIVVLILAIGFFIFFSSSTAVTKNIDKYEYDLPFKKGAKYRVVQGYGGLFSHTHIAALDFDMPTGRWHIQRSAKKNHGRRYSPDWRSAQEARSSLASDCYTIRLGAGWS